MPPPVSTRHSDRQKLLCSDVVGLRRIQPKILKTFFWGVGLPLRDGRPNGHKGGNKERKKSQIQTQDHAQNGPSESRWRASVLNAAAMLARESKTKRPNSSTLEQLPSGTNNNNKTNGSVFHRLSIALTGEPLMLIWTFRSV